MILLLQLLFCTIVLVAVFAIILSNRFFFGLIATMSALFFAAIGCLYISVMGYSWVFPILLIAFLAGAGLYIYVSSREYKRLCTEWKQSAPPEPKIPDTNRPDWLFGESNAYFDERVNGVTK